MITFVSPPKVAGKHRMMQILQTNPSQAKFFSRLEAHQELIAIIPTCIPSETNMFYWVWLSSREDGAYCDGNKRSIEQISITLDQREWNYQPNIQISLEHFEGS